jgi:quercetin dioxygenase-like cupin family protein
VSENKEEKTRFIKVNPNDVGVYTPEGHDDTYNQRLVGPNMGAKYVEVILGEMGRKGVADPHVHKNFEQIIYLLEGNVKVISQGAEEILEPGDLGFIPVGVWHQVCPTKRIPANNGPKKTK